jgi:type III restriction enzyme
VKFELKDFQEEATSALLDRLKVACALAAAGAPQAVILSSPTASGKTVTIAALMERILKGDSGLEANPHATFLWVSDSPELNMQSLDKVFRASDAFPLNRLITVDASFDQERFLPGHLYFINTSKLGKDKLLTTQGDNRTFTFWQTVANTAAASPGDFFVIIDEAHRGMGMSAQERKRAQTIVQKFILGSPDDRLPPVPLIIGMSATPQRFFELLGQTGGRSVHPVIIRPEDVRDSGLLKEMILVQMPNEDAPTDLTLLEEATRRWVDFGKQWQAYCESQNSKDGVRPVLVVQVEDGNEERGVLTRTNLNEAVRVIERIAGPLSDEELAHCFQEDRVVEAGGHRIRKVEASRIQDEPWVRVVFFKMSLTTGWDCPRAEVMMSFRRAKDHTLIAQLVGRMIRTPLARRIEGSEVLNTVELFLPHYDTAALNTILEELRNPDAEIGIGTRAEKGRDMVTYPRATGIDEVFSFVESLPSYSVGRVPELPPIKRCMRLAARLTLEDALDANALDEARDVLVKFLIEIRNRRAKEDPKFADRVRESGEVELITVGVQVGTITATDKGNIIVKLTPENVEDIFARCGRTLGAGEGLHLEFWKKLYDPKDPMRSKLELHEILRDPATMVELEKIATAKFDEIYDRNKPKIAALPTGEQEAYNRLLGAGKEPAAIIRTLPLELVSHKEDTAWTKHLYCRDDGTFLAKLNSWERAVLEEEMKRPDFVAWLRNIDRKDWALAVPYKDPTWKPFYPDFIVIRRVGKDLVADLLDPHNAKYEDTWAKAKGLAEYADKHGHQFGRLEIDVVEGGRLKRMNVNDPKIRNKARKFQSNNDVDALFT